MRSSEILLVLLQYFEDRFASFYVDEPLSNSSGQTENFLKVKFRSFLRMSLIAERDGALAATHIGFPMSDCLISEV